MASVLICFALVSLYGVTHSPTAITNKIITRVDFMAEFMMFQRLIPAACITTNSLLLASTPIPIRPPSKVAIGKNCSKSRGKLSNT